MEKEMKNYFARFHKVEKAIDKAVKTGEGSFKFLGFEYTIVYHNYRFILNKESWDKWSDGTETRTDIRILNCSNVSEFYKEIVDIIY